MLLIVTKCGGDAGSVGGSVGQLIIPNEGGAFYAKKIFSAIEDNDPATDCDDNNSTSTTLATDAAATMSCRQSRPVDMVCWDLVLVFLDLDLVIPPSPVTSV